jgi:hypothetical protein
MDMKDIIVVQLDLVACTLVACTPHNCSESYMNIGVGHRVGEIPLIVGAQTVYMVLIPAVSIPK